MIKIEKENVYSRVVSFDTKVEEAKFREVLRFKVPNSYWTMRYRHGWDGTYSFFNKRTNRFPTGMLELMPEELKERFAIVDRRVAPEPCEELLKLEELVDIEFRDYQMSTIEEAVSLGRCAIEAPCGAGKTELAIGITFTLGVRTLFCVHLLNLLYQAKERFETRFGIEVGVINSSVWEPKAITVAMVPTIYSRLKAKQQYVIDFLQNDVDCIFFDEVHHMGSASAWETPGKFCNAYYRFGLSATVMMKDDISNARLIGQTGKVISAVSKKELIERGTLADPKIKIITNAITFTNCSDLSWQSAYHVLIEDNTMRNNLIASIVKRKMFEGKQTLVIVHTLRHARALMMSFNAELQKKLKLVTGAVTGEDRQRLIKRLDKKEILCIVATPVFDEGADIPTLKVVVLAGGGKSPIKIIQRIGRGMRRKTEGENEVEVYDFLDIGNRYTKKHSVLRQRLYKQEAFETELVNWE